MKPPSCSFLQLPVTSFLRDPNILLSPLFSHTISWCYSLNMRDQFVHPYKQQAMGFFFLIFEALCSQIAGRKTKNSEEMVASISGMQWAVSYIVNKISNFQCCFRIFELCYIFSGFISYAFVEHSGEQTWMRYLIFFGFTQTLTSPLATARAVVFLFMVFMF